MKGKRLLTSWKFWAGVAGVVAALWLALFLWWRATDPDRILAESRGANGELSRGQVERLMTCMGRDSMNRHRRDRYARLWSAAGSGVAARVAAVMFTDRNAQAKIAHEGRAASPELLKMAADAQVSLNTKQWVLAALGMIDPYGGVQAMKPQIVGGQTASQANMLAVLTLQYCLPFARGFPGRRGAIYTPQMLICDLASKSVDTIVLERLDVALANPDLWPNDQMVLPWLNRYRGADFDEWLAKNAKDVFAFRNREMERGCDPVKFAWIVSKMQDARSQYDKDPLKQMYPNETDRKAFTDLWRICSDYKARSEDGDWRGTLTQWYSANRSRLVYDPKVMRFVVGPTPVRAEVSVDSTDAGAAGQGTAGSRTP